MQKFHSRLEGIVGTSSKTSQKDFKFTKTSLTKTWLKTKGISERAPGICERIPEGAPMQILEETFGEIAGRISGRIHRTT